MEIEGEAMGEVAARPVAVPVAVEAVDVVEGGEVLFVMLK